MARVGLLVTPGNSAGRSAARAMGCLVDTLYIAGFSARDASGEGVQPGDVRSIELRIDDSSAWERAASSIADLHGHLDFLVVGRREVVDGDIFSVDGQEMSRVARMNLLGPWLALKHCLPLMSTSGASVVFLVPVGEPASRRRAFEIAEYSALKIMMEAAVLDGAELGHPARINCLRFCPETSGSREFCDALDYLLSSRSAFMSGSAFSISSEQLP